MKGACIPFSFVQVRVLVRSKSTLCFPTSYLMDCDENISMGSNSFVGLIN